ncbi:beta-ketoacyl synthase N-terminal-like domain-containing protein [Ktedonosporobacter rubrisoli]|uniref:beta-ketoacyl synthase N-terminal-like domain-containing protein n=1 Tax=Ktedonosporobacter rubrisoli TaxID=2509675 RepID=UPI001A91E70A|nr:polyketide synthase [Ktedonosporobacter rubrisoli]
MSTDAAYQNEDLAIAIIGMAGRFPQANTLAQFWQNLQEGRETIRFFPDEELLANGVDPRVLCNPQYVKARHILEDIDLFDAAFFGYSSREAEIIDPQHRLFLECAWEALENAGYDPQTFKGPIGIYAGGALMSISGRMSIPIENGLVRSVIIRSYLARTRTI